MWVPPLTNFCSLRTPRGGKVNMRLTVIPFGSQPPRHIIHNTYTMNQTKHTHFFTTGEAIAYDMKKIRALIQIQHIEKQASIPREGFT